MTLVSRQKSKIRQVFGLIIGSSFAVGLIGLGIIFASSFHNTELYWSSLWTFMGFLVIGIIGARIHGIIWRK